MSQIIQLFLFFLNSLFSNILTNNNTNFILKGTEIKLNLFLNIDEQKTINSHSSEFIS